MTVTTAAPSAAPVGTAVFSKAPSGAAAGGFAAAILDAVSALETPALETPALETSDLKTLALETHSGGKEQTPESGSGQTASADQVPALAPAAPAGITLPAGPSGWQPARLLASEVPETVKTTAAPAADDVSAPVAAAEAPQADWTGAPLPSSAGVLPAAAGLAAVSGPAPAAVSTLGALPMVPVPPRTGSLAGQPAPGGVLPAAQLKVPVESGAQPGPAASVRDGMPAVPERAAAAAVSPAPGDAPTAALLLAESPQVLPTAVKTAPQAQPAQYTARIPLNEQLLQPVFSLASAPAGTHTMTLNVTPDNLGPVAVRAHISAEGVRVELVAASEAGREALRAILVDLKRDLTGQGLNASLELSSKNQQGTAGGESGTRERAQPQQYGFLRGGAAEAAAPSAVPRYYHSTSSLDVLA